MLHELTRSGFQEWLAEGGKPLVILAVGSIEQHGPHLPLGTDSLSALAISQKLAQATGALVVQPCWPGYSPHHMGFPGTITFKHDTLLAVLIDTMESLVHHGVSRILILNFHGGNAEVVGAAERLARRKFDVQVMSAPFFESTPSPEEAQEQLDLMDFHSGTGETSFALAEFPQFVEMDRVKDWRPSMRLPEELKQLKEEGLEPAFINRLAGLYLNNSHEFSDDGIWGYADPNLADPEAAAKQVEAALKRLVRFVEAWETLP